MPISTSPGAGAHHDVGHAESAANLDQLAARHHGLTTLGERVEYEKDGGGIVVDDSCILRAGELAEQAAQVIVALAALAGVNVEFEGDGRPHGGNRGFDRRLGDQRAAEIGVQHRPGEIEDGTQVRSRIRRELGERRARDGFRLARLRFAGAQGSARRVERLTHRHDRGGPPEPVDGKRRRIGLEDIVDRRQCAQSEIGLGGHCSAFQ